MGIGARPIPTEPMYLLMNLVRCSRCFVDPFSSERKGMSDNFGTIEITRMTFRMYCFSDNPSSCPWTHSAVNSGDYESGLDKSLSGGRSD